MVFLQGGPNRFLAPELRTAGGSRNDNPFRSRQFLSGTTEGDQQRDPTTGRVLGRLFFSGGAITEAKKRAQQDFLFAKLLGGTETQLLGVDPITGKPLAGASSRLALRPDQLAALGLLPGQGGTAGSPSPRSTGFDPGASLGGQVRPVASGSVAGIPTRTLAIAGAALVALMVLRR